MDDITDRTSLQKNQDPKKVAKRNQLKTLTALNFTGFILLLFPSLLTVILILEGSIEFWDNTPWWLLPMGAVSGLIGGILTLKKQNMWWGLISLVIVILVGLFFIFVLIMIATHPV
jgi:hypothetical protein